MEPDNQQIAEILRHVERMLHDATRLRIARDKEDKANKTRAEPVWTKTTKYEEKMEELEAYLKPGGVLVGLQIGWDDTHGHVLYSD